jgi:hypothetical protein
VAVEGKQDTKPGAVRLMEVSVESVESSPAARALRILLPGGAAIEVADAALAAQLIIALA